MFFIYINLNVDKSIVDVCGLGDIMFNINLEGRFLGFSSAIGIFSLDLWDLPWCSFSLSFLLVEYVQSSIRQLNGLASEWVFMCLFSWPASTNPFPQVSHLKHLSPLWALIWAFNKVNLGVQYWHPSKLHRWTFPSCTRLCAARCELYLEENVHSLHLNFLSSVCTAWCWSSVCLWPNDFWQMSQINFCSLWFFSCFLKLWIDFVRKLQSSFWQLKGMFSEWQLWWETTCCSFMFW